MNSSQAIQQLEQEKQVWEEVRENMSQRIVDLSEKLKKQESDLEYAQRTINELKHVNDQLNMEKDEANEALANEKRNSEGQVEQILRLNEEVIHTLEEKTKLEEQIENLKSEIRKLEEGMNDPKNFYRTELGKVSLFLLLQ